MPRLGLRYDLRTPDFADARPEELYAAALDQCTWADALGFQSVTLSEHHGSDDGYLPSPLVFGGAVAGRTRTLRIRFAALIAAFHDPLRLAEDLAVLDLASDGRVDCVLANGYVREEFEMFGRDPRDRARAVEEAVRVLDRAWTGEAFEHRGRTVRVTPRPRQRPRPPIWLGGSSDAAARRAARIADLFLPSVPEPWEAYREECRALGKPDFGPLPSMWPNFVHVSNDPERDWEHIVPHALHEANAYGRWAAEAGAATGFEPLKDAEELRASGRYRVLTPGETVELASTLGDFGELLLHPLMGGLHPERAWQSLRLFESEVLPRL